MAGVRAHLTASCIIATGGNLSLSERTLLRACLAKVNGTSGGGAGSNARVECVITCEVVVYE